MARKHLILDRYEPLGTAGEGGFGTVEIAWDPRIQRKVAIKTIALTELDAYRANLPGAHAVNHSSPTADRWHGVQPWDEFLAAEDAPYPDVPVMEYGSEMEPDEIHALSHLPGLDEARTAAMLSDPRIVTVYDFEIRDRFAYLIMEYVEGLTLTQLLADYADFLTLDMVTAVFDAMAGALTVAHKAGVLHLDIKPDNIIINLQGQAKVTDFGLATLADAAGKGTTGGGTIGYMPLEQMRREHLDARTDEWSLASVLYEMLTGDNPFRVETLDQAEAAIEEAELILPSLCWDDIDEQIDDVLFYALDPNPDERYASVADFAEEADKFLGDADVGSEQLSLAVADALGLAEEEEGEQVEDWASGEERERQPGFFARLFGYGTAAPVAERNSGMGDDEYYEDEYEDDYDYDDWEDEEPASASKRTRTARRKRMPLTQRIGKRQLMVFGRLLAAVCSGIVVWVALGRMPAIPTAFGLDATFVKTVASIAMAAIGAIVPPAGLVIALALLGISFVV